MLLKYKYMFQIKYTEAISSNSTRKLLWFEVRKCWLQFKWINLCCHWVYNFRHTFVPRGAASRRCGSCWTTWTADRSTRHFWPPSTSATRRLPARSPLQTAPFRGGYIIRDSLDPTRPHPKRHLDRFSRFAGLTVLKNISHPRTDKLGHVPVCPFKSASFGGASGSNTSIVVLRFWSSSPAASRPLLDGLGLDLGSAGLRNSLGYVAI